jgi:hypothetical protein
LAFPSQLPSVKSTHSTNVAPKSDLHCYREGIKESKTFARTSHIKRNSIILILPSAAPWPQQRLILPSLCASDALFVKSFGRVGGSLVIWVDFFLKTIIRKRSSTKNKPT